MAEDVDQSAFAEDSTLTASMRIEAALWTSLRGQEDHQDQKLDHVGGGDRTRPAWPSGIDAIDYQVGGLHGFTGLVGPEGVGKSDLALRSGLLAAHPDAGWHVLYVNGELDPYDIEERSDRVLNEDPAYFERAIDRFTVYHADRQTTPEKITHYVSTDHALEKGDAVERLLIILDTTDTLALWREGSGGRPYLQTLSDYYLWAMGARKLVPKRLGFLCVSEVNQQGKAKGQRLEKWADVVLRMKKTEQKGEVELFFTKGRRTGEPNFGKWVHDWQRARFHMPAARGPDLRMVKGGEPFGLND